MEEEKYQKKLDVTGKDDGDDAEFFYNKEFVNKCKVIKPFIKNSLNIYKL